MTVLGIACIGADDRQVADATWAEQSLLPVTSEFPHVPIVARQETPTHAVVIDEGDWARRNADLYAWDRAVLELGARPGWIGVLPRTGVLPRSRTLIEILTRYQRLMLRLNVHSLGQRFAKILAIHRALHDLDKPLVRADYDHALDVWQWVLRLAPQASLVLQLAALFHDIERLASEADARIEQHATDYQAFKDAHARKGARMTARCLAESGFDADLAARVHELILEHERPASDAREGEATVLCDADALSFFSLNSPGFADYYGPLHTQKKVRYSLGRMSLRAQEQVEQIKLRADIQLHVERARATCPAQPLEERLA